ncbi:TPA: hypothetical protein HL487_24550, partial [Escherichia coli]|nr:hypothetical protein [Escherichia coli]
MEGDHPITPDFLHVNMQSECINRIIRHKVRKMSDTFLTEKILTGENVLRAATARIEWIFETFPSVCLSFS